MVHLEAAGCPARTLVGDLRVVSVKGGMAMVQGTTADMVRVFTAMGACEGVSVAKGRAAR